MSELDSKIYASIQQLSRKGDELAEVGNFSEAIATYNEAWKLVPEPKNDWEASTWLLAAIGDACFLYGRYKSGMEAFKYALTCPDGFGNPFIHLRLGQCQYELREHEKAIDNLLRAYALEGKEIFQKDNPKYFDFLKSNIDPPASGIW